MYLENLQRYMKYISCDHTDRLSTGANQLVLSTRLDDHAKRELLGNMYIEMCTN